MARITLSAKGIGGLDCEQGKPFSEFFHDKLAGFGVRVMASGKKVYFVKCRAKGRTTEAGTPLQIKHTLGTVTGKIDDRGRLRPDSKEFDGKYEEARAIIDDAKKGITPSDKAAKAATDRKAEDCARKLEEQKDVTLGTLVKGYLEDSDKLKDSTKALYRQCVNTHISDWLDLPAREISKEMVKQRHKKISERRTVVIGKADDKIPGGVKRTQGGKGAADGTMRVLRAVFNYGMDEYEEAILSNPVVKALSSKRKKQTTWHRLERRQSVITPVHLKEWFAGLEAITHPGIKLLLQVAMFTGARKNEIAALKWADLALDATPPAALFRETKAGTPLLIPLAGHVVGLVKAYKETAFSGPDGYVFPSYGKTGHITDTRKQVKRMVDAGGVGHMLHDLRRGFVTYCNHPDVSVTKILQKRLVGHAIPNDDVTEGYNINDLEVLHLAVEKVAAFILKHASLDNIPPEATGCGEVSNVVSLEDRRRKKRAA